MKTPKDDETTYQPIMDLGRSSAMTVPTRIRALSIHATYACRHSGACCRAGWRIPVETATEDAVSSLIATGAMTRTDDRVFERAGSLTVTALDAEGACVFFERASGSTPHLCAIHRLAGPEAKPAACRHFPRIALHDGRGVSVSLSHFCPTAADLLFEEGVPLTVVDEPAAYSAHETYEGLTAIDALPPLIAPGMLMDLDAYDAFERHMVAVLARSPSAVAALAQLAGDVEHLRRWRPAHGPLIAVVNGLTAATREVDGTGHTAEGAESRARRIYARLDRSTVARATPSDLRPHAAQGASVQTTSHEVIRWNEWDPVIRRYLAARAFASWVAYQGRGLRTVLASLYVALDLVRHEAARLTGDSHLLTRSIVKEAIRHADVQLVHHADSQRLADLLGRVEEDTL